MFLAHSSLRYPSDRLVHELRIASSLLDTLVVGMRVGYFECVVVKFWRQLFIFDAPLLASPLWSVVAILRELAQRLQGRRGMGESSLIVCTYTERFPFYIYIYKYKCIYRKKEKDRWFGSQTNCQTEEILFVHVCSLLKAYVWFWTTKIEQDTKPRFVLVKQVEGCGIEL